MKEYYLLLGSNLGDRAQYLEKAKEDLKAYGIEILEASSLYETEAWGSESINETIGAHLNQVIKIKGDFLPHSLLSVTQSIEHAHDRKRAVKWGNRTLDIDILYYGQEIIQSEHLIIPHPQIQHRRFTLVPLVEVAKDFKHPLLNLTQSELLMQCSDPLEVKIYDPS